MTYSEAANSDITITRKKAVELVNQHGLCFAELAEDVGYKDNYLSSEVLQWLGY